MFSNEIETLGGHISGTTAVWEVLLGFLDAPKFPLQKSIKIGKVPKIAGNRVLGGVMYFPLKTETWRSHNSSTPWSWRPQSGFLDAPWIPLNKSIFSEKVTRDPLYAPPGGPPPLRGWRGGGGGGRLRNQSMAKWTGA